MSVNIDWNYQTDLTLLSGVETHTNKTQNTSKKGNNTEKNGVDGNNKKYDNQATDEKSIIANQNIKIKKEIIDNVVVSGNINSSLASAVLEARFLYLNRKPESFANVPVNPRSKQVRKRHCIRYAGNENISAACVARLPKSFLVSPTCCAFDYSTIIHQQQYPSQLSSECSVVDHVNYKNEWWIYVQSSKPTKTFIVCNFVYAVCGLNDGCFFTDEIPGGRDQIKRYEYIKLQHFKHCIRELKVIGQAEEANTTSEYSVLLNARDATTTGDEN